MNACIASHFHYQWELHWGETQKTKNKSVFVNKIPFMSSFSTRIQKRIIRRYLIELNKYNFINNILRKFTFRAFAI